MLTRSKTNKNTVFALLPINENKSEKKRIKWLNKIWASTVEDIIIK